MGRIGPSRFVFGKFWQACLVRSSNKTTSLKINRHVCRVEIPTPDLIVGDSNVEVKVKTENYFGEKIPADIRIIGAAGFKVKIPPQMEAAPPKVYPK